MRKTSFTAETRRRGAKRIAAPPSARIATSAAVPLVFLRVSVVKPAFRNRFKRFKSIALSFLMLRILAHAARVGALAADAFDQKFGDDVQSLGRREIIALDRLVGVDRHACVRARAPVRGRR